jgi:hypothetical protein
MGFVTNIITMLVPIFLVMVQTTLTRGFNDKWSGFVENQGFKVIFIVMQLFVVVPLHLLNKDMQIDVTGLKQRLL